MQSWRIGAAALALPVCLLAASYENTQQKSFTLGGGDRRLIIDNIQGDIRVNVAAGSEVRINVRERFNADTESTLAKARNDVRLEMVQSGSEVKVSLEGPFRDRGRNSWRGRDDDDRYSFRHDFDVTVPRDIALELRTVNGSEIRVAGTSGEFNFNNVNGKITAENIAGWGRIRTVNGTVRTTFSQNPVKPVSFETVNGELDATFQPGLNADIRMSTFHGEAFTDFDIQPMTMPASFDSRDGGKRIRIGRDHGIRIGSGGVEHSFKTLNGSIKIRKGGNSK